MLYFERLRCDCNPFKTIANSHQIYNTLLSESSKGISAITGNSKSVVNATILPKNGDTGGVDPAGELAGETGGDPFPADGLPAGLTIMMLRVTFTGSTDKSLLYDLPSSRSDPAKIKSKSQSHHPILQKANQDHKQERRRRRRRRLTCAEGGVRQSFPGTRPVTEGGVLPEFAQAVLRLRSGHRVVPELI